MKILLLSIGRTSDENIRKQLLDFNKRLSHYIDFNHLEIPNVKNANNLNSFQLKQKEGDMINKYLLKGDYIILLDENGKSYSSIEFSKKIENFMINSFKRIVFIIGGAYGFSDKVYSIADEKVSLSKMTFNHQMIRVFFYEQLYRAFTIIKNEKYHNQ